MTRLDELHAEIGAAMTDNGCVDCPYLETCRGRLDILNMIGMEMFFQGFVSKDNKELLRARLLGIMAGICELRKGVENVEA
jgi:hypothetical protein